MVRFSQSVSRPIIAVLRTCLRLSSRRSLLLVTLFVLPAALGVFVKASHAVATVADPGPRGGPAGAGGPLPGLSRQEMQLFTLGQETIQEVDSVSGTVPDTGLGLGPRFNMDSCDGCHNSPAPGGASPAVNPLVAVATKNGGTNKVPFFITSNGPILRAFILSGSVGEETHLYTITGRQDAPGCVLTQPDFDAQAGDLAFHMPLPLYGDGLVDNIDTSTITDNLNTDLPQKMALGIAGHTGGVNGTGRFFWKGQGSGLEIISADAYQNEVGVTNQFAPNENDPTASCHFNQTPEDKRSGFGVKGQPDFDKIAGFIQFSAGPAPIADTPSIANGRSLFSQIGCAFCHTPSLQTGASTSSALDHKTAALWSDLALHKMGPGLADGLAQGNAAADEFRTAPLWGLGQRIFFLHDGRTTDLTVAISQHSGGGSRPSEANAVISNYNALTDAQKQDVLNFLRSL